MNIALILSGGTGSRLGGDIPKQYIEVGGKPIIAYCLETFQTHPDIDAVRVVAAKEWHELIVGCAGAKLRGFSEPGQTRQLSIWNGLQDIRHAVTESAVTEGAMTESAVSAGGMDGSRSADGNVGVGRHEFCRMAVDKDVVVLIHDAARPLVSAETISACLEGCAAHDGVMPALPVKDTVYYGADGRIESLLERSKVIAGQAPEAFRLEPYYEANRRLLPEKILRINGSTEPAILAGLDVQYIAGDERNFKITTQADLERFREIVKAEGIPDKGDVRQR